MGYSQYSAAAPIVVRAWEALAVLLTPAALVWVSRLFIRAVRSSMPPPAERPVARTAQFVGAAVASLLVVGPVDVRVWNLAVHSSYRAGQLLLDPGQAAPIVAWALPGLAVLLTPAALVWVTRLFIRALRSSRPRALIALVAVTAVSALGPYLWHAMTPSPRAQALAVVHAVQPCVRAVNQTVALLSRPAASVSAIARAVSDQDVACDTAQRRMDAMAGTGDAGGAQMTPYGLGGTVITYAETLTRGGRPRSANDVRAMYAGTQDDQFMFGSEMDLFALTTAHVLHVSPACVSAALDPSTYGAGCRRLPAILR
jgi:hypothetical protein